MYHDKDIGWRARLITRSMTAIPRVSVLLPRISQHNNFEQIVHCVDRRIVDHRVGRSLWLTRLADILFRG